MAPDVFNDSSLVTSQKVLTNHSSIFIWLLVTFLNIQNSIIIGSLIIGIAVLAPTVYERYEQSHKIEKLSNAKVTVAESDIELLQEVILHFKKDHGRYPDSLEELTPDYVNSVAIDPWGQKYEYKREDGKYELYSSGLLIYK